MFALFAVAAALSHASPEVFPEASATHASPHREALEGGAYTYTCTTHSECSLNGLCNAGQTCDCDTPWVGERCQTLELKPGPIGLHGIPLCAYVIRGEVCLWPAIPAFEVINAVRHVWSLISYIPTLPHFTALDSPLTPHLRYHGDGINSTSWGGSVLHAPEDGKYYMWAASMVNNCTMDDWETNSEVVLATSNNPLGPFERVKSIVPPWAHNPQAIRAPDNTSSSGCVYALCTMGVAC